MPHNTGGEQSPNNEKSRDNRGTQMIDRPSSIRRDLTRVKPTRSITQIKSIRPSNSK
jgi:hypothetical protein